LIKSFKSKALKRLYERDDARGLNPKWVDHVRIILARLDATSSPDDMALPGSRLHALRGDLKGPYVVSVSPNWRITFAINDGDVMAVDLVDCH
jgi:proteic killer suppression protein